MKQHAGLSLTEVLIAAALMLMIALSIIPLFQRSVVSNISGGEATQVSTGGVRVGLESLNQTTLNHTDLTIPAGNNTLAMDPVVLDSGALVDGQAQAVLGDERWVAASAVTGRGLWVRETQIRNFTYADIHSGTIGVTGTGIVTLGDPYYFDTPRGSGETWDIKSTIVAMASSDDDTSVDSWAVEGEESNPLGKGQRLAVSLMRSY